MSIDVSQATRNDPSNALIKTERSNPECAVNCFLNSGRGGEEVVIAFTPLPAVVFSKQEEGTVQTVLLRRQIWKTGSNN